MPDDLFPITIVLTQEEKDALIILAKQQRRDIQSQAAMMVRHGLEEYGLVQWHPDWQLLVGNSPVPLGEAKTDASPLQNDDTELLP